MARTFHLAKCFVVLYLVTVIDAKVRASCKTDNINGPRGHCLTLCGNMFKKAYEIICFGQRKRDVTSSEAVLAKYGLRKADANQFLSPLSVRSKVTRRPERRRSNPVEECCNEQCVFEEVQEYCWTFFESCGDSFNVNFSQIQSCCEDKISGVY